MKVKMPLALVYGYPFHEKETYRLKDGSEIDGWNLIHFKIAEAVKTGVRLELISYGNLTHQRGYFLSIRQLSYSPDSHLKLDANHITEEVTLEDISIYHALLENIGLNGYEFQPRLEIIFI